jgi:hypothetical protein
VTQDETRRVLIIHEHNRCEVWGQELVLAALGVLACVSAGPTAPRGDCQCASPAQGWSAEGDCRRQRRDPMGDPIEA